MTQFRGTTTEGIGKVATLALFTVNLICALLVADFCNHFPKPCKSTSLKIIKLTPTVP